MRASSWRWRGVVVACAFLGTSGSAFAQSSQAEYPKKTTDYYDVEGHKLPSAEGADHRMETTYSDSLVGTIRLYYPSGQVKANWPYGDMRHHILHGTTTTWYETGQMHTKEDFLADKRSGDLLVYYPDGKVRRRDQFDQGQRIAGECFGSDGQPVPYFEYEQMPIYPDGDGGNRIVVEAIQRQVKYPRDALKARKSGRVFVSFTVTKTGEVADIKVVKSVFPSIDMTVVEAVQKLKKFVPGQQDGQPVAVSFTVPVTFKIQ